MGHVLGLDHDAAGVMEPTLAPGVRRLIGAEDRLGLAPLAVVPEPSTRHAVVAVPNDGSSLLAPQEIFPVHGPAFSADRLTGARAFPLVVLPGEALPALKGHRPGCEKGARLCY